jgi:hypothetical protein
MTKHVFSSHTIICGWNERGKLLVESLRKITHRPILVLCESIDQPIREIGKLRNVYVLSGDPTRASSLKDAEVATAKSVVVLRDDLLGESADAQSVKVALAVERIQVAVHTVVELHDNRNKSHFAWTKVDEVVSEELIATNLVAQAIRLTANQAAGLSNASEKTNDRKIFGLFQQYISLGPGMSQIWRVDVPWEKSANLSFSEILAYGLMHSVVPVALVGYRQHLIQARPGIPEWASWKTDVWGSPIPKVRLIDYWQQWPSQEPLGIIVLAKSLQEAEKLGTHIRELAEAN